MELEFQNYPKFTPEMKKTHKILIPNMAPVQFRILAAVMRQAGYTCELLENCGSQVSELGLKYVHNDTCYPALLVIGQFLDAPGLREVRSRPHRPDYHPDWAAAAGPPTTSTCCARPW